MTIVNGYCTLAEVRAKLKFSATNTSADTQIEYLIEGASRWIDRYTGRRFYGAAETRYYTADDGHEIMIDDLTSVSALKTDDDGDGVFETTWTATDYHPLPLNAALDGKPYTAIVASENGDHTFPKIVKGVLVRGQHGYVAGTQAATACPDPVHAAAILLTERLYKRGDAPLGIAGPVGLGQQQVRIPSMAADPDIAVLLGPFVRKR